MGSSQSTTTTNITSKRKPTTSSGFLGRERNAKVYKSFEVVSEINGITIGKKITERCGDEEQHPFLDEAGKRTLRFLRAANSFIPDAKDDGADMENAAFILRLEGREFVIIAGNGDWEYDFCEDADGVIYGRCVRQPILHYAWSYAKWSIEKLLIPIGVGLLGSVLKDYLTS